MKNLVLIFLSFTLCVQAGTTAFDTNQANAIRVEGTYGDLLMYRGASNTVFRSAGDTAEYQLDFLNFSDMTGRFSSGYFFSGRGDYITDLYASELTTGVVAEPRLHYAGTDPAAGLVLTSTSSNTPAWLAASGGVDATAWHTTGDAGLGAANFLGTLDNVNLKLAASNSVMATFSGYSNTIVLGNLNFISGWQPYSVISGGRSNLITGPTNSAFWNQLGQNVIAGGASNSISDGGLGFTGGNTIGGGNYNSILDGGADASTVAGGSDNDTVGYFNTVSGGFDNDIGTSTTVIAGYGTIGGGLNNTIVGSAAANATNDYATISGGRDNTASGAYAVVPGGNQNTAAGSNSIAMGFKAAANHPGSVVISADVSATTGQASPANNSFTVNATGGINLLGSSITGNGAGITNLGGIKIWRGTLTQTGTGAPTATVHQNTLGGTITWARSSAGVYTGTLTGAFTASKTLLLNGNTYADPNNVPTVAFSRTSANVVTVSTLLLFEGANAFADDVLVETSFQILVQP